MRALRPIGYEDRLSVTDHLDELRARLMVCGATLLVAFIACFAFNHALISVLNRALPPTPAGVLGTTVSDESRLHRDFRVVARDFRAFEQALQGPARSAAGALADDFRRLTRDVRGGSTRKNLPITTTIGEPFTTTLVVAGYFALLFSLPVILYQLYAFVLPALSPAEKRVALPAMLAAPLLFASGAVFTYFEVLPPAVRFLQGYNSSQFLILLGAGTYYKFEIFMMLGIGLAFQVPLLLLALQKAGVITASTLTVNWRYAIVIIAVIAAALPGVDPVTMAFETLPLIVLYLASIVLLQIVERRARRREAAEPTGADLDTL
jgi:sec-independent protein translocase protein TatC